MKVVCEPFFRTFDTHSGPFSVIHTVLLSPPNFKRLDRLAMIFDVNHRTGRADFDNPSPGHFLDWRQQSRAFDQMVRQPDPRNVRH